MASFVANFQSPFELDELEWCFREGEPTNLDCLFEPMQGEPLGMWSVPKWAKAGDCVFLMCAATSTQHMAHVCKQARESADERLIAFADVERAQYKRFAAHILALGRVAAAPIPPKNGGARHSGGLPFVASFFSTTPCQPTSGSPSSR